MAETLKYIDHGIQQTVVFNPQTIKMKLEKQWSNIPLIKSPLVEETEVKSEETTETSWFRHFTHSTNVELFYDLFFVANLTAFTGVHEVNDGQSLKDYVGFFFVLWFTWYQISLYEVRFGMDSIAERIGKAIQFIVMIVFSVCGPQYSNTSNPESLPYLHGLTIALMISRLTLVAEYLQVCYFARNSTVLTPMMITAATYFTSAMVYLGLFWSIHPYIGWYILGSLETAVIILITSFWRSTGFIGTHFVERMSLLTLIILGEGAIETARAVQTITTSEIFSFYGSVSAMIVCAILNIYFMYLIYFDWLRDELFGNIRIQLWAFTHFPLHIALALSVTGAAQCITWNAGVVRTNALINQFSYNLSESSTAEMWNEAAMSINETASEIFSSQLASSSSFNRTIVTLADWSQKNNAVIPTIQNGTSDPSAATNAIIWITRELYHTIFIIAGFEPPESPISGNTLDELTQPINFNQDESVFFDDTEGAIIEAWRVFRLTYTYFFIATGAFLGLVTILAILNHGRKSKSIALRFTYIRIIALALGLLSIITVNTTALQAYVTSPWLIPTVTLSLFSVVIVTSIHLKHNPQDEVKA